MTNATPLISAKRQSGLAALGVYSHKFYSDEFNFRHECNE
jgi:hypothetical protein